MAGRGQGTARTAPLSLEIAAKTLGAHARRMEQQRPAALREAHSSDATYGLPPVLDIGAAAAFVGVNRKTLYMAVAAGDLPARRVGKRRLVILRHVLLEWLSQVRVPPNGGRR